MSSDLFSFQMLYDGSDLEAGEFKVDMEAELEEPTMRALERVNDLFLLRLLQRLSRRGTGHFYRSRTGHGKHQASAPGEAPAPDTQLYKDSWESSVTKTPEGIVAMVSSYLWNVMGRRLELGGHGGGAYIAPRPHVIPTLDAIEPLVGDQFE